MANLTGSERVSAARTVLGMVAAMWLLEILDTLTGHALDGFGIRPRATDGLFGVVVAPFLHFGFGHLLSNTVPFALLGLVIAVGGTLRVVAVTAVTAATSGLGIWLIAPATSVTAGASGVVFGFAAYLVARGAVARNLLYVAVGAVVVAVFGTVLLTGLVPQVGISWQGHLFGALGGVLAARILHARRPRAAGLPPA